MAQLNYRFQIRRGTAAQLAAVNEVPMMGEFVWEDDQGLVSGKFKLKIGDGVTPYNSLPYLATGGGIDDVFGDNATIGIDKTNPKNPIIKSLVGAIALKGRKATYSALPASGNTAGDAYLVDADSLVYVWNGTAWPAQGSGLSVASGGSSGDVPPTISQFPTVVGSGATITDKTGRLDVQLSNSVFMHAIYQTCPSPPYTIDAHVSILLSPNNGIGGSDAIAAGMALCDGTKVRGFYMGFWGSSSITNRLSIDSWPNSTTFGAQVSFQAPNPPYACDDHRIRITDDGTNRRFYLSKDGKRFFQAYSEATNTYLTPNLCGLFFHCVNTLSIVPAKVSVLNWKLSNSVLGDAP